MDLVLYGLKNCDTCGKARKALPEATFRDVRDDGVPEDLMQKALTHFGAALMNTRSTTWRGLSEDERSLAPDVLLMAHPALMKRPLIAAGDTLFLGWTAQTEAAIKALL